MKRIIICCDGTWNSPDQEDKDGLPCPTNVVKLAAALAPTGVDGMRQLTYYDSGVGTLGGSLRRHFDGGTGTGLSNNVKEAYWFLIQNHEPGDELFFFGFSRGAFTVRSLGGLIRKTGILRRNAIDLIDDAYDLYRSPSLANHPREREATLFRKTYAVSDKTPIRLIGVWDTVGALGNPIRLKRGIFARRNEFHDLKLSSHVQHAYQALAIDEERRHFNATLWQRQSHAPAEQVLEQIWFAGVHADVGGGYSKRHLSDITLEWMVEKARKLDLGVGPIEPVPDPDEAQEPHNSRTGFYKLTPVKIREIANPPKDAVTNESLHPSVLKKWRENPYRPASLQKYFRRNPDQLPDDPAEGGSPPANGGSPSQDDDAVPVLAGS